MASSLDIGDEIPRLETVLEPDQIRRYAVVARLPGKRFVSDEVARKEGLPGQIVPGNMSMALLSKMVLDWLPGARLEKLGVTFRGLVLPGKRIVGSGFVTDVRSRGGDTVVECDLVLECDGERRVTGMAVVAIAQRT
ncbi:MAG: hypothetical protein QOD06_2007 [Candidatus Binatota bacterium]|jgi:acyl dehydratase|nr:hypothetical protein [Candidatus Binatota bacterium]